MDRVVGLWRYPVKSMMGGELNADEVTDRGLVGDRLHTEGEQGVSFVNIRDSSFLVSLSAVGLARTLIRVRCRAGTSLP